MTEGTVESNAKAAVDAGIWHNTRIQLAIFVLLYLVLRLPWVFTLPITEAPDEGNHFWVCQFLTTNLRLPTGQEVLSAGGPAEYGSLPQFGYLPNVVCSLFASELTMPTFSRIGSVIAGIPTLLAAFLIGKEIFPGCLLRSLALPLLIVLHPQLVFTQSYTNTDATTVSLASVSIYLVVCAIKRGLTMKASLALGFLLGWLALSKHTGLSIVPALGLGVLAATFGRGEPAASALKKIFAAAGVFAATCGWWFVRNYFEFSGDILGSRTMYETWSKILPRKDGVIVHPWPEVHQFGWWRFVFFDFFGLFGYMNRYIYRPAYIAYFAYVIAAVVGWCGFIKLKNSNKTSQERLSSADSEIQRKETNQRAEPNVASTASEAQKTELDKQSELIDTRAEKLIWLLFLLCPLLNLAAMLTATLLKVTGPHGRYLFPSIIPIDALLIAGFFRLGDKFGKWATLSLLALHVAVTVGSWLVFYPPR
ncbi:MAG TPA: hypothetical protein EYN91_08780 [Candidatus Melainabacteria bacterium]|nr:hypothetical protein [Candidatus Melainabacteria bacterium]